MGCYICYRFLLHRRTWPGVALSLSSLGARSLWRRALGSIVAASSTLRVIAFYCTIRAVRLSTLLSLLRHRRPGRRAQLLMSRCIQLSLTSSCRYRRGELRRGLAGWDGIALLLSYYGIALLLSSLCPRFMWRCAVDIVAASSDAALRCPIRVPFAVASFGTGVPGLAFRCSYRHRAPYFYGAALSMSSL